MTTSLLGSITIAGFAGTDLDMLIRQGFRPVNIAAANVMVPGVLDVELSSTNTTGITPGAHIEVAIPLPHGPAIRHYSLVASEDDSDSMRIAILRETDGQGGSNWLHHHLPNCTSLLIRGPRDTFGYHAEAPSYFVAGGIGITPITAMIAASSKAGLDWHLLYIGRRREEMALADELIQIHGHEKITIHTTEEAGRPDVVPLIRQWAKDSEQSTLAGPKDSAMGCTVYTCGPASLMTALEQGFADDPDIAVISENFATVAMDEPSPSRPHGLNIGTSTGDKIQPTDGSGLISSTGAAAGNKVADHSFIVELGDGSEIKVPSGCTIIDALKVKGIRTLSSCKKGTCGTCETVILEGKADHRDSVLSAEEHAAQETMMICVSRACTERLSLDL